MTSLIGSHIQDGQMTKAFSSKLWSLAGIEIGMKNIIMIFIVIVIIFLVFLAIMFIVINGHHHQRQQRQCHHPHYRQRRRHRHCHRHRCCHNHYNSDIISSFIHSVMHGIILYVFSRIAFHHFSYLQFILAHSTAILHTYSITSLSFLLKLSGYLLVLEFL